MKKSRPSVPTIFTFSEINQCVPSKDCCFFVTVTLLMESQGSNEMMSFDD